MVLLLLIIALAAWLFVRTLGTTSRPPVEALLVVGVVLALFSARAITRHQVWVVPALVATGVTALAVVSGPDALNTLRGPLGYANTTAALYTAGVGAACVVAVRARPMSIRMAAWLLAIVLAVLPFLVRSLAAAAGAVLVLAVTAGVTAVPRAWRSLVVVAGIGTVLVFLATLVAGVSFADEGGDPTGGLLSERRLVLWSEALDLIADQPVVGVGMGGFAETAPTAIADADARWAHAELLELGAEAGLPALVLGLGLLVWTFVWLDRGSGRRGAAVAAATLAASSAQAHVDHVWHHPAVLLALAVVVGAGSTAGRSIGGHEGLGPAGSTVSARPGR